ncbi:MAG: ornithine carbamoyltransferase [Chloroflexota bacterium]
MRKDLLSVADLDADEVRRSLDIALRLKGGTNVGSLGGKSLALVFEKPSLRTRASFDLAIFQLGGHAIYLSPDEVGVGQREPVEDVARVLARYVNAIAARTFSHRTLVTLAKWSSVPVINALSDTEHPCQALADMLTIYENKERLEGLRLAYVGDGNNVATSLLFAAALTGVHFRIASPQGYGLGSDVVERARQLSNGEADIMVTEDPSAAVQGADVVYTDVWTSMGQEMEVEERRRVFAPFQVDRGLLSLAAPDAVFMHPLPAHHGEEVAAGVLDLPQSLAFDQAENRLHMQKALLLMLLPQE